MMSNIGRSPLIALLCLASATSIGCQSNRAPESSPASGAELRTDSTQYTVRFVDPMYQASIGYVYTNHTSAPVSANYCRNPAPPTLEKEIADGRWVVAYDSVVLLCQTIPPFRVAAGGTYRGTLHINAARKGAGIAPTFNVDSIPGTYRLRWSLRAGPDPDDKQAATIEAISKPFRLVEP